MLSTLTYVVNYVLVSHNHLLGERTSCAFRVLHLNNTVLACIYLFGIFASLITISHFYVLLILFFCTLYLNNTVLSFIDITNFYLAPIQQFPLQKKRE